VTTGRKRIWLALALLIAVVAVAGVLWERSHRLPPQIITLPNGQQYRFAGVSYGTKHVQPTLSARLVSRLPSPLANFVQRMLGKRLGPITSFKTQEPSLCVWFEWLGTNASPAGQNYFVSAMLSDQNDVMAGYRSSAGSLSGRSPWPSVAFGVVPRRSRELQCVLFDDPQKGPCREVGRVRFPNPLFGRFPQWQPEALPAVKSAGDLEVRLENLMTGVLIPAPWIVLTNGSRVPNYRPAQRGEEAWTFFDLSLTSSRGTSEAWEIASADLSDATGNHIHAIPGFNSSMDGYRNAFRGTCWPDEAAWRLKLELKRKLGFPPAELITFRMLNHRTEGWEFVTFKNVPVLNAGATNTLWRTNAVGGVQIVLREYMQEAPGDGSGLRTTGKPKFRVEVAGGLEGFSLDFVTLTTDTGEKADTGEKMVTQFDSHLNIGTGAYRIVALASVPADVKTVGITWAVQKTRSVEFLVKSPKAQ
jgi:hypothetical protein